MPELGATLSLSDPNPQNIDKNRRRAGDGGSVEAAAMMLVPWWRGFRRLGSMLGTLVVLSLVASSAYALQSQKLVSPLTSLGNNVFVTTVTLVITNDDGVTYFDVQAFDDLTVELGAPENNPVNVNAPGEYAVTNLQLDTSGVVNGGNAAGFAVNAGFNGSGVQTGALQLGNTGSLAPNDVLVITFDLRLFQDPTAAPTLNVFTAAADTVQNGVPNSEVTQQSNSVTLDMVSGLVPFTCAANLYLGTGNPTQLNRVSFSPQSLVQIGSTTHGIGYASVGYRVSNNLIYGLRFLTNELVAVDSDGNVVGLGPVAGLPNGVPFSSGGFVGNNLYVIPLGTNNLFSIDVDTRVATLVGVSSNINDVQDIAFNPVDGFLYGVRDVNGELMRIDPLTATSVQIGNTGIVGVGIGGAWFDNIGNMYVFQNSNGFVYQVDVGDASTVALADLPDQTLSSGASCENAGAPTPPLVGAALDAGAVTHIGNNVFEFTYTARLEAFAFAELFDLQATLDLSASFGTRTATANDVNAPGEYFTTVGAVDTSGVLGGNNSFSANGSFTGAGPNTGLLNPAAAGSLRPGDFIEIPVTVRFFPDSTRAPYDQQLTASADASANGVANAQVTDLSAAGDDPDDNGDIGGNDNDNNPANTDSSTSIVLTAALTPFACTNDLYINVNIPSQFNRIDFPSSSFVPIGGTAHNITQGAMGYDLVDNLIYAIDLAGGVGTNRLLAIDSNGTIAPVGSVTGLPSALYGSGDFVGATYYVIRTFTNELWAINVDNLTASQVGNGTALATVYEMATNPLDGQLYGVRDSNKEIVRIDPTNAATTTLATTNLVGSAIDAVFFDSSGNFYVYESFGGRLYQVDLTTGNATLLITASTSALAGSASCNAAPPPFEIEVGSALNLVSLTDNGATYTAAFDLRIENTGEFPLYDIQAVYDLRNGFGTPVALLGDVDAAGEFFADVISIDTTGITNGGNTTFAANGAYDGGAGADVLDAGQPGFLNPDDFVVVRINVTLAFDPAESYLSQFTAEADQARNGAGDANTADLSTAGTDVDDNGAIPANDGDGDPNNTDAEVGITFPDFDGDGINDALDIDDDNDGCMDVDEGNGLVDTDGDGFPDSRDIDADNDGITDNVELQGEPPVYIAPSGVDTDNDGLDNAYDPDNGGTLLVAVNTDGADTPDFRDADSDNDGIPDLIEGHDANFDGVADVVPANADADADGLDDAFDTIVRPAVTNERGSNAPLQNRDGTDNRDWRDTDDDNDGVGTVTEGGVGNDGDLDGRPDYLDTDDLDGDGVPDTADVDDDNDGLPDVTEGSGAVDSDGDGRPDSLDIDADNDGIPDNIEAQAEGAYVAPAGVDTDGDGLDNAYDPDNGGAAIVVANTDAQDDPDYRDLDTDNDGIPDLTEGHDANFDGVPDRTPAGADADADGLDDSFDTIVLPASGNPTGSNAPLQNADGTDNRDWRDTDDDNDGVGTVTEGGVGNDVDVDGRPDYLDTDDFDGDGVPDPLDIDEDNDGIPDADEGNGTVDTDGDGRPDSRDIDADNDGIPDNIEAQAEGGYVAPANADTDGDGLDNAYDPDNGGTAIVIANTDGQDLPDFRDPDSDNDGIPDLIEGHDADSNGVADRTPANADADADGLDDAFDTVGAPLAGNSVGSNAPLQNTDGADARDWRDTDDDNDGTTTIVEGGVANNDDADNRPDYLDPDDFDGDGVPDSLDADDDGDGIPDVDEGNGTVDTDGDGRPDSRDIDADNDGIPDNIEAQAEGTYRAPAGIDADGDGLDNAYDPDNGGVVIVLANTDGADQADFRDPDSDNDGVPDTIEGHDADFDGVADVSAAGADADADGLDDAFDTVVRPAAGNATGSNAPLQNADATDNRDWRDTDDDNDGDVTLAEDANFNGNRADDDADRDGRPDYLDSDSSLDADADRVPDATDPDADNDGVTDLIEGGGVTDPSADHDNDGLPNFRDPQSPGFVDGNGDGVNDAVDADRDGIPNHLDIDSDNDGIPDVIEAQGGTAPSLPSGADADNDGIDDVFDAGSGGTPVTPVDGDADGLPDYLDPDSDNDGVPDLTEGHDADINGVADRTPRGSDGDRDGLDDAFDTLAGPSPVNAGRSNAVIGNTDNADTPDFRDADDDNDGVNTVDEDRNANGNRADDDADRDGIPDYLDAILDIASLAGTVFRDLDSDDVIDATDTLLATWRVEIVQNGAVIAAAVADDSGRYAIGDLRPGTYQLQVRHPQSNVTYSRRDITLVTGDNLLDQNFPIDPSGVVYDTDSREPLPGTRLTVQGQGGNPLPEACVLPGQQDQVTAVDGAYRVDLVLGADPACPSGETFVLDFTAPAGYVDGPSATLPPSTTPLDPTGQPGPLLVQPQATPPRFGQDTTHFLQFVLQNGDPDVVNNHVAVDPVGEFDVRLVKRAGKRMASVGDLVSYTIEVNNVGGRLLNGLTLVDQLPPGFRFVEGSVRTQPEMPTLTVGGERPLVIGGLRIPSRQILRVSYLLRVGAGVAHGEYINRVNASLGNAPLGNQASATVDVVADPDFEQTTIIGKVFDDRNGNGMQDAGEPGVPGVRLATVTGLLIETDAHGRYHLAGVDVSRFDRGQNFYLKLDTATLPEGSEMVSDNPRVTRITQGLMSQIDFAVRLAAPRAVEAVEIGDVFFEPGDVRVRPLYLRLLDDIAARFRRYDGGEIVIVARAGQESLAVERGQALRALLAERLGEQAPDFVIVVRTDTVNAPVASFSERRIVISGEVFFDTDGDTLKPEFRPLIESLAAQIRGACNGELVIEGHADQRGDPRANQELSRRRTEAVRKALEEAGAFLKERRRCEGPDTRPSPLSSTGRAASPSVGVAPATDASPPPRLRNLAGVAQYLLGGLLAALVPSAVADDVEPCQISYCASDEGVAVRILNHGEDQPRQSGNTDSALQDNRRVSVDGFVNRPGEAPVGHADSATISGRMRSDLADGSTLWLTEDPLAGEPMLSFAPPAGITRLASGLTGAIGIPFYTNYAPFLERLELSIYAAGDADRVAPVAVLEAVPRHLGEFLWSGPAVQVDREYFAVLRGYDESGNFDETRPVNFVLSDLDDLDSAERLRLLPEGARRFESVYGRSDLERRNVPLAASRVRLHGDVRGEAVQLRVDGMELPLADGNRFAVEYLLPVGSHELRIGVSREGEEPVNQTLTAEVTGRYMFLAGLADLTVADNNLSGSLEPLSGDDRYDDDFTVDGRLAFYLKGKIRGKYLITAQLDTREEEIGDLFSHIHRKDPDALFRRLDPDRYYPVYGDDSTTVADVNTLGRMYVRVDWDKTQLLWGNYDTGVTGTEFAQYNRSLYGARAEYNSTRTTELGDARTHGKVFVSETQSAYGHAEFLGTGGSLYYLPHTDILPGSEKVTLEVRDRNSNRVLDQVVMVRGQDYEVDEIQGRIILARPLMQVRSREGSIVRNQPLDGDSHLVLVDYEYVPRDFSPDHVTYGGRGKQWFGEHLAIGGTYVSEGRGAEDYRLYGVDLTVQKGRGTYAKVEYAASEASQSNGFYSDNGGLSFRQRSATDLLARDGDAIGFEGRMNFRELGWTRRDLVLGSWWRDSAADFSIARRDEGLALTEYGFELAGDLSERIGFSVQSNTIERGPVQNDLRSALLAWDLSAVNRLRFELQQQETEDTFTGATADELVVATEFAHTFSERFEVFAGGQLTLADSGSAARGNDMLFAGTRNQLTDRLRLETEVTTGNRGEGVTVAADYMRNDRHTLYGSFTHSTDTTQLPGGGEAVTFGNRFRVSNQTTLFAENQFVAEDIGSGFTHAYGVDFAPRPGWSVGATVQKGDLDAVSGLVDRRAFTVHGGYRSDRINWRSVVEFRQDKGTEAREQVLTTNMADLRLTDSFRALGKFNYSETDDKLLDLSSGKFTEAGFGLAYRPVNHNRLNVLAKYTYLYDLQSLGQFNADFDQRSHIAVIEGVWQVSPRWKLGAKAGQRWSQLRAERAQGAWFDSTVRFLAGNLRYNIMGKWDGLVEYRQLEVEEDNSVRDGFLVGVDRQLGDHLQLGVGYNFADFSDDLRILDYDQKGWFVNIVGKF